MRWVQECPKKSAYYWAIAKNQDSWLDGSAAEVVYLYFDGKWSVMRPAEKERESPTNFAWWSDCPVAEPDKHPDVEKFTEDK